MALNQVDVLATGPSIPIPFSGVCIRGVMIPFFSGIRIGIGITKFLKNDENPLLESIPVLDT